MDQKRPDKDKTESKNGTLIMAATSIGDHRDVPTRTLEALRTADLVIGEEHRPVRQLLRQAGIHRAYELFSEHNQRETLDRLISCLKGGGRAIYVSDQGSPALQDPGRPLIAVAHRLGARLQVIPGPSSLTAAISACPYDLSDFYFVGFLPAKTPDRLARLRQLAEMRCALVLMDTPYRRTSSLQHSAQLMPERDGFLAADITGPNESFLFGPLPSLARQAAGLLGKLNFVLIIDRPHKRAPRRPTKQT